MRAASFDLLPVDGEAIHQRIDELVGLLVCSIGQVGIAGGGQDAMVA